MVSLCVELADIITDSIACYRLVHGKVAVVSETYKAAYIVLLCVGAVATGFSISYRVGNGRLVRKQLLFFAQQLGHTRTDSQLRRQAQQHEWELAQTHRTKVTAALTVMSVLVQGAVRHRLSFACVRFRPVLRAICATGLPMTIMNCLLVFREKSRDEMVSKHS